jgi:hypothetical protein
MNDREQLELESYLREFQPRAPKALPVEGPAQNWRRLAACIVLSLLGSASLLSLRHHERAQARVVTRAVEGASSFGSSVLLTHLALENPREFASRMDQRALHTLERFDRPDSALRTLAKE